MDGEPEYEIAEVLDSKMDNQRSQCKLLYLVCWTRYASTDEETSWILALELENAPELISDFHQSYPAKLGPLGQLYSHMFETLPAAGRHKGDKPLGELRCRAFF